MQKLDNFYGKIIAKVVKTFILDQYNNFLKYYIKCIVKNIYLVYNLQYIFLFEIRYPQK